MDQNNIQIIIKALNNASYLISEEYQSLENEELKQNYNQVLAELENALRLLDNN